MVTVGPRRRAGGSAVKLIEPERDGTSDAVKDSSRISPTMRATLWTASESSESDWNT